MCEPASPFDRLKEVRTGFGVLMQTIRFGNCDRILISAAADGLLRDLDWVIANLARTGEGHGNCGLREHWLSKDQEEQLCMFETKPAAKEGR